MKKYSPTTPSRRQMTSVSYDGILRENRPVKSLLIRLPKHGGRNNQGKITMRHQGGENAKLYRLVDFKQDIFPGVVAHVETIEYDPYRTAFIACVVYKNGTRSYILASRNMKVGDELVFGSGVPIKEGNRLSLKDIPVGYLVHNVEINKGKGGQMSRSAGSYAEVLAHDAGYTHLKLSSGEVRKIAWDNAASIGQISNADYNLINFGKAGRVRHLGVRPTVRGSVMNPCDHPYGGGEGRTQRGLRKPKTIWGKVTGGHRTRNKKKWSNNLIVKRRIKK